MIKVDEALREMLGSVRPLGTESIDLSSASSRVAARDIFAGYNLPPFDNSAMDGYAVSSSDTIGARWETSRILDVIEDLPAGNVARGIVSSGKAIRIMTGAPIPEGADSVVMVEDTKSVTSPRPEGSGPRGSQFPPKADQPLAGPVTRNEYVEIFREVKSGKNIRKAGEDVKKGELVIQKGKLIRPAEIGMLAALGIKEVMVVRRPKVAILATGDEMVDIEEDLAPGKIRNSNSYALSAGVLRYGAQPQDLGIARDDRDETEEKIRLGLSADMVLVIGGVSVGDYDFVKPILEKIGIEWKFQKVAMRPGKPLVFGFIDGRPVFGLPGNPVSCMVTFEIFVRPAISKMSGESEDMAKEVDAEVQEGIDKKKGFRYFLRAKTTWQDGRYVTRTTGPQGSGILSSMVFADSLIILPEQEERIEQGSRVRVRFLD